ncbi:MAG: hypothetical protein OSJ66_04830 [Clostridia bacterium]|nr:hypothetical protein [Clostridia bacterium]
MKVLFAVSSESISEAIIKRYQKEYKEILSYKNVYYFNAILKEIQKDKTYDRIVISEDLEPFSNNNYDTIDKFIFEKLDSISDEAHDDNQGKEASIILICTDRRVKGNSILVKLFGIGVYNALLGNDRSMDEVCKLINRPRSKKEAKIYYRIDSEDVNYKAENENEVSEVEIQNILAHFKKLGRNTVKYSESFNNIAAQYTDEQLRIIVNCLPINVKAILESECQRYQELMAVTGKIPSVKGIANSAGIEGIAKNEISQRTIGHAGNITKPIVIPSAVRNAKNIATPAMKKAEPSPKADVQRPVVKAQIEKNEQSVQARPVQQAQRVQTAQIRTNATPVARPQLQKATTMRPEPKEQVVSKPQIPQQEIIDENILPGFEDIQDTIVKPQTVQPVIEETVLPGFEEENNIIEEPKRGRGRPRKTPVGGVEVKPKGKRGRPKKIVEEEIPEEEEITLPGLDDLGDFEDTNQDMANVLPEFEEIDDTADVLPGFEDEAVTEDIEDDTYSDDLLPGFEDEETEEVSLPGLDDLDDVEDAGYEEVDDTTDVLPGFEDETVTEDVVDDTYSDDLLSGFEDVEETEETEEVSLPGLDDLDDIEDAGYEEVDDTTDVLPGFEDETVTENVVDDTYSDDLLPGVDDMTEYEEVETDETINDTLTSGYDELGEEDYTDEVALPGLDDLESEDSLDDLLPGTDDVAEYEEVDEDDGLLPGLGDSQEYEEETLLPGMGFEDEEDTMIPQRPMASSMDNSSLESIKPKVDYSMSSLNSLITKDKKIVTFIGTSKNGNSFLVNNLAALFSSLGINTAILDMTKNKNSYFIFTKNEEELRTIAYNSIEKLQNGYAEGVKVDKNLTVYTDVPFSGKDFSNAEPILSTLVQNHSLILIDCDYDTDISYFASCQEMYLVQSMDILTIQPLTAFLRELKTRGVLEPEKIRVVINKEMKIHKKVGDKDIIGGLAYYNDPAMSFMTELFNKDTVKAISIPFDANAYARYLGGIVDCEVSLNGYSKQFLSKLKLLGDMVYPLTSKQSYSSKTGTDYNPNAFSNSMNDTLSKMRKKY